MITRRSILGIFGLLFTSLFVKKDKTGNTLVTVDEMRRKVKYYSIKSDGRMNICEVLRLGIVQNRAFRDADWPKGLYAYHGMDNQICLSNGRQFSWAVATLLNDNFELADAPYHGPLTF